MIIIKYVETRGKINAYENALHVFGVNIDVLFDGQNRNNQFIFYILDGEEYKVKVWDLPMILYGLLRKRSKELIK